MIELITTNHFDTIMDMFEGADKTIDIISPFLTKGMAKHLCSVVNKNNIKCRFITRLYLEDLYAGANDIYALEQMVDSGIEVYIIKGLHAKLYLFDNINAILGSANFTSGGLRTNVELSLLIQGEKSLVENLNEYFNHRIEELASYKEGRLDKATIELVKKEYLDILEHKKKESNTKHTTSTSMYGADIDDWNPKNKFNIAAYEEKLRAETSEVNITQERDSDVIYNLYEDNVEEIVTEHTIWLKFAGESNDRYDPKTKFNLVQVQENNKKVYVTNYPYDCKSIKKDDEIYMAILSIDKDGREQPIIIGHGTFRGSKEDNLFSPAWEKDYPWMKRYPYYCVIEEASILDTNIENGIPLSKVIDRLRSNTYVASFGKNESFAEVSKKHYQKAHIRLSGNAKEYIDKELLNLEKQYGMKHFVSE